MNNQRDLLPWLLGGLTVASIAAAITVASSGWPLTPSSPRASAVTAQVTAAPVSLPLPPPAPEPGPAADATAMPDASAPPTAQAQTTTEPPVTSGQIWECMTNGVKTFSNNPCGENSTLLEVRGINTMNPTPEIHYARAYAPDPRYAPQYADQNASDDQNAYAGQDTYAEQGNADYAGTYAVVPGFAFLPRHRPERDRRPDHENPHRPPSHQNSEPPMRRN